MSICYFNIPCATNSIRVRSIQPTIHCVSCYSGGSATGISGQIARGTCFTPIPRSKKRSCGFRNSYSFFNSSRFSRSAFWYSSAKDRRMGTASLMSSCSIEISCFSCFPAKLREQPRRRPALLKQRMESLSRNKIL